MYTKYFGLTKEPFENTPDPDFLFLSKNHREVLASLSYAINAAKGFVLVVKNSFQSFVDAVNGKAPSPTSGELGRDALAMCDAIMRASVR